MNSRRDSGDRKMRFILRMGSMKIKFFAATVFVLTVYFLLVFLVIEVWFGSNHSPTAITSLVLPYVVVHIDLKGAPPKLKYLESLLPMLKNHGVNALLIEYEDTFPYEGKLLNISATNCYSKPELTKFLKKAMECDLEIIPLIQTFGHMEHVLKLDEFRHLREIPVFPDSLCPSRIESRALVKHMLEQVIYFHNTIAPLKHIHVGCDEVLHINKCEQCAGKKLPDMDIFIQHVRFVSEYIKETYPMTTVLIWDDMLRSVKPVEWNTVKFLNNIQPVYWDYGPSTSVSHVNLLNYHNNFNSIWIASAFKGADGRVATVPNLKQRFMNHFSWMNLILDYKFGGEENNFNFKGVILTGWSRYSHMDPVCELLPVAIPSLLLNLLVIRKYKTGVIHDAINADSFLIKYIDEDFSKSLHCDAMIDVDNFNTQRCNFESNQIYDVAKQLDDIKIAIANNFTDNESGLSSMEYYAAKKFVNINNVLKHVNWCNSTLNELVNIEVMLSHFMKRYYSKVVIDEYVNYKTYSAKKKLNETLKAFVGYASSIVWGRNPFAANISMGQGQNNSLI